MFLILPNNLFPTNLLSKEYHYALYEHPLFFRKNIHIFKLILHRLSMLSYYDELQKKGFTVTYITYTQEPPSNVSHIYDPANHKIEKQFKAAQIHPSPLFLHTRDDLNEYHTQTNKPLFHHSFKVWSVQRLNVPHMEKSYDTENRAKMPKGTPIPCNITFRIPLRDLQDAKAYIDSLGIPYKSSFTANTSTFLYPTNRKQALALLDHFIEHKLQHFGKYQDSMVAHTPILQSPLFHSMLSSSINIGLITPKEIVQRMLREKPSKTGINSYEGFLRQIVGWREYMRYAYQFHYPTIIRSNHFGNTNRLSKAWWDLQPVGILPIDDCMDKLNKTGYLHHIERLMVLLNWMVLTETHPKQMFEWFNDMFIDAYDWVMLANVYIFSYSHEGSRKPYISSSNYIVKMSDYGGIKEREKGDGGCGWREEWDSRYRQFIRKKKEKLRGTIYYTHATK